MIDKSVIICIFDGVLGGCNSIKNSIFLIDLSFWGYWFWKITLSSAYEKTSKGFNFYYSEIVSKTLRFLVKWAVWRVHRKFFNSEKMKIFFNPNLGDRYLRIKRCGWISQSVAISSQIDRHVQSKTPLQKVSQMSIVREIYFWINFLQFFSKFFFILLEIFFRWKIFKLLRKNKLC